MTNLKSAAWPEDSGRLVRPSVLEELSIGGNGGGEQSLAVTSHKVGTGRADATAAQTAKSALNSSSRLEWVDIARGIGILLVVAGHALGGLIDSPLGGDFNAGRALFFCIYTFHMPLFLMLSGLLVGDRLARDPKRFRGKLWSGIAWPYFLWSAVQLSVIVALGKVVNTPLGDYWGMLLGLPLHTISQFWFLYALFLLHLLAIGALGPLGREGFVLVCMALKPLAMIVPMPDVLRVAANHALFYGIGVWLAPAGVKALAVDRGWLFRAGLIVLATSLIAVALGAANGFDPTQQLGGTKAPIIANLAWRYETLPAALAGAFATVALATFAFGRPAAVLKLLGRRTMPIFVFHIMAIAGTRIFLIKFVHMNQPWTIFLIASLVGIALPLLADLVIRRLKLEGWLGLA